MANWVYIVSTILAAWSVPASALPIHETYFYEGMPQADELESWSKLPGMRSFLLRMGDPSGFDLQLIGALRGADRIRIEISRMPGEDSAPAWKALAAKGVELVTEKTSLPTESEVERLNRIGFAKILFMIPSIPGREEAARLSQLRSEVSVRLATGILPKYEDRENLLAIPATIPLLLSSENWPWYNHMDLLNMLPHSKQIRVKNVFPDEVTLDYLNHIQRLGLVEIESDFDAPDAGVWDKMPAIETHWIRTDGIPSEAALASFESVKIAVNSRKLVLNYDEPPLPAERRRLEKSPLPVEWIHSVGKRKQSSRTKKDGL